MPANPTTARHTSRVTSPVTWPGPEATPGSWLGGRRAEAGLAQDERFKHSARTPRVQRESLLRGNYRRELLRLPRAFLILSCVHGEEDGVRPRRSPRQKIQLHAMMLRYCGAILRSVTAWRREMCWVWECADRKRRSTLITLPRSPRLRNSHNVVPIRYTR